MSAGLVMQFLWTDWRPQYENKELLAHTGLYYSGGLNKDFNPKEPQARDDDYLLLLGFYLLLEHSTRVQSIFANPLFVYLGRRSLSKLTPKWNLPPILSYQHSIPDNTNVLPFRLVPRPKHHHLHRRHQAPHELGNAAKLVDRGHESNLSDRLCHRGSNGRGNFPPRGGPSLADVSARRL